MFATFVFTNVLSSISTHVILVEMDNNMNKIMFTYGAGFSIFINMSTKVHTIKENEGQNFASLKSNGENYVTLITWVG